MFTVLVFITIIDLQDTSILFQPLTRCNAAVDIQVMSTFIYVFS